MHRLAVGALAGLALCATACLRENVQYCNNGAFCPEPLVCTERTEAPFCGSAEQVDVCLGKPDETACSLPGDVKGYCDTGLCTTCDTNNAACVYDEWVAMQTPVSVDLYAIWAAGPRDVFAAGRGGTVIRWNGRTWSVVPFPGAGDIRAMSGVSGSEIFASVASVLFRFDGAVWTEDPSPPAPFPILSVWGIGPNDFLAGLPMTNVGRYGGSSWTYGYPPGLPGGVSTSFNGVWGTGTDLIAVGSGGVAIHGSTTTGTWSSKPTGSTHILLAVGGASPNEVYAVGRTAGGVGTPVALAYDGAWTDVTASLPAEIRVAGVALRGVWASGGHAIAVGDNGKIVHHAAGTWTALPAPSTVVLNAVSGSGSEVFAAGNGGTVVRYHVP